VHEWWGLNDYVRSRVNKLAQLGYIAFALDMYGKNVWTTDPNKAKELMGHLQAPRCCGRGPTPAWTSCAITSWSIPAHRRHRILLRGTTVLELAYAGAKVAGVASFHGG